VFIGPAFAQPYVNMDGAAGLPDVASASAETEPGAVPPTLIAAVATLAACVFAAGKGGEVPAYPANVHWAIVKPQTGEGPGGALFTVSVSLALSPVSNVPINRLSEVLVYVPAVGTITLTLIVQVLLAAMLPFEKLMMVSVAVGEKLGEPQPVVEAFGGLATIMTPGVLGKVSLKFNPLNDEGVGLVIVKVRVETPPTVVGSGLKLFEIVTAEGSRI
jgi:hypothetical protein